MRGLLRTTFVLASFLAGCSSCETHPPAATNTPPVAPPTPVVRYATLEGTIRIADGAEVPTLPAAMIPRHGNQNAPEFCSPPRTTDRQLVRLAEDGHGLSGVIVTVTDFEGRNQPPHQPQVHDLTIRDCRLTPTMIDATAGDTLRLHNDDDFPFLPSLTSGGMTQALIKGQTRDISLARGGSQMVGCGAFGPACGRSDVLVLNHPVHALSDATGHFRIAQVPSGEPITVTAVGLMYRPSPMGLTLQPGETRRVDFVLTPTPFAEPAPAPAPDPNQPTMF